MDDLTWVDEPPQRSSMGSTGNGRAQRFVNQLQSNPGRWAIYPSPRKDHHGDLAKKFPDIEWTSRSNKDGSMVIYGRHIGNE